MSFLGSSLTTATYFRGRVIVYLLRGEDETRLSKAQKVTRRLQRGLQKFLSYLKNLYADGRCGVAVAACV